MLAHVPFFPESRPVDLADRELIEAQFLKYPTEVSERTFGSMYMWRQYERRSQVSHMDDHLIVSWFRAKFGRIMFPPVGPEPSRIITELGRPDMLAKHEFNGVFGIVEPLAGELKAIGLSPSTLRDEWDYVYRSRDLIELSGPDYHTQRKELKKLPAGSDVTYEPMTKARQEECLLLEEKWCDLKHCTMDRFSAAEDRALKEAIANLEEIGFFGGVVLVDGKLQALTVGERLNANTAAVHFEKANPMIRGLYQFINQQFCINALKDFEFVNKEQDVGEPGLRRAKEGYHPHHFVEKQFLMLR